MAILRYIKKGQRWQQTYNEQMACVYDWRNILHYVYTGSKLSQKCPLALRRCTLRLYIVTLVGIWATKCSLKLRLFILSLAALVVRIHPQGWLYFQQTCQPAFHLTQRSKTKRIINHRPIVLHASLLVGRLVHRGQGQRTSRPCGSCS